MSRPVKINRIPINKLWSCLNIKFLVILYIIIKATDKRIKIIFQYNIDIPESSKLNTVPILKPIIKYIAVFSLIHLLWTNGINKEIDIAVDWTVAEKRIPIDIIVIGNRSFIFDKNIFSFRLLKLIENSFKPLKNIYIPKIIIDKKINKYLLYIINNYVIYQKKILLKKFNLYTFKKKQTMI